MLAANLAANESVSVQALGSTYTLTLASGTWSGSDDANVTGNGTAVLTVTPTGKTALGTLSLTDTGPNASVSFADSGTNTYSCNLSVVLDDPSAGPILFAGTTSLTGANAFSASTTNYISIPVGGALQTVDGNLDLKANEAGATTVGDWTGVDTHGLIASTGAGQVTVIGHGTGIRDGVKVIGPGAILGGTGGTTVVGTAGLGDVILCVGVLVNSGGRISSSGGDVSVTGQGGGSGSVGSSGWNYGVEVSISDSMIGSTGSGKTHVQGTGGNGTGGNGVMVYVGGTITSGTGGTTVTGMGGPGGGSASRGILVYGGTITSDGGDVSITGQAGGSGTSSYSIGVSVMLGGVVTAGSNGNVSVAGTGGAGSGGENWGIEISGSSATTVSTISTSGSGKTLIVGIGGMASDALGVYASLGVTITSGAGGTTVTGTGGSGVGWTSRGILVYGGTITSDGGDVNLTGQGGGSGTAIYSIGVSVLAGGAVTTGGNGNLTLTGNGGAGSGGNNWGVELAGASSTSPSMIAAAGAGQVVVQGKAGTDAAAEGVHVNGGTITSGGGDVRVTGIEGSSNSGFAIHVIGGATITTATNGGNLSLIADSVSFDPSAIISAGRNTITIKPYTSVGITLGATSFPYAGPLSISQAELLQLSANKVFFGDANSGNLTLAGPYAGANGLTIQNNGRTLLLTATATTATLSLAYPTIRVTQPSGAIRQGKSVQLNAVGTNPDGTTQDITSQVTFSSATPDVATVTPAGMVTIVGTGTPVITATFHDSDVSGSTALSVIPLKSVVVSPASATIDEGFSVKLTVMATWVDGKYQDVTVAGALNDRATWLSKFPFVATVSAEGNVVGVGGGTTFIGATFGGVTGYSRVDVNGLTSLSITQAPTLHQGVPGSWHAVGTYADNHTRDLTKQVAWSSTNTDVASANAGGAITPVLPGTTVIGATLDTMTTTLPVTVVGMKSLVVTPPSFSAFVNTPVLFSATGYYDDGLSFDVSNWVKWSTGSRVVNSAQAGPGTVQAWLYSPSGTRLATSNLASYAYHDFKYLKTYSNQYSSVDTYEEGTRREGYTDQFDAYAVNPDGSISIIAAGQSNAYWSTSDPLVATVSSTGLVTAIGAGTCSINLTYQGYTQSFTYHVIGLDRFEVVPPNPDERVGSWYQHAAYGYYTDGAVRDLTSVVTWSSSSPSGMFDPKYPGWYSPMKPGSQELRATLSNGVQAVSSVNAIALQSIAVTPLNPTVAPNVTQQFTATGTYANGTTRDLTSLVSWNTSNSAVATISSSGLATGVTSGTTSIVASFAGVSSPSSEILTVSANASANAVLESMTVAPANSVLDANSSQQVTATGRYSDGTTRDITSLVTWSSTDTSVANASSSGLIQALAPGRVVVQAVLGSIRGETSLSVSGLAAVLAGDGTPTSAPTVSGTAFAVDVINDNVHEVAYLNDGVYGDASAWISGFINSFAGLTFGSTLTTIGGIAWSRDNTGQKTDHTAGTYIVQYTTVPNPGGGTPFSSWTTIGSVTYDASPNSALSHTYTFAPVQATGVRILTMSASASDLIGIDELSVYSPVPAAYLEDGSLNIMGTNGNDVITVVPAGSQDQVNVTLNGVTTGPYSTNGRTIHVHGLGGDDTIKVDASYTGATELYGDEGNDTLAGGKGSNYMNGGTGTTDLAVPSGNDTIVNATGVAIYGSPGDNNIKLTWHLGSDPNRDFLVETINGRNIEMDYTPANNDPVLTVLVVGGSGNNIILMGPDPAGKWNTVFYGGPRNNVLVAGPDNPSAVLVGGPGNNVLVGGGGVETIIGGSGVNTIYAGAGTSVIRGGSGTNIIHAGAGTQTIDPGTGLTVIHAGPGHATIKNATALTQIIPGSGKLDVAWVALPSSGFGAGVDAFTAAVFADELHRAPSQVELRFWARSLRLGLNPNRMVASIAKSSEHLALIAAGRARPLGSAVVVRDALTAEARAQALSKRFNRG